MDAAGPSLRGYVGFQERCRSFCSAASAQARQNGKVQYGMAVVALGTFYHRAHLISAIHTVASFALTHLATPCLTLFNASFG